MKIQIYINNPGPTAKLNKQTKADHRKSRGSPEKSCIFRGINYKRKLGPQQFNKTMARLLSNQFRFPDNKKPIQISRGHREAKREAETETDAERERGRGASQGYFSNTLERK